ncbi:MULTISPECIES: hypothetical protein [unclassified Pseudomonas]|uniref:hypothetical protein n=1 Tax=unclassified Pseudomonas TaxID=196821 RepID=UPI001558B6F6|nr:MULTISPECIES: hypothetical protein [unclassified Pseudomonas]
MATNQSKALFAWGWILWIACAYWLAGSPWLPEAEWSFKGFAFLVVLPKGIQGYVYWNTLPQNRYSAGYTDKHKRLLLYAALTLAIGLWGAVTGLYEMYSSL